MRTYGTCLRQALRLQSRRAEIRQRGGSKLRHGVIWDLINKLRKNPHELEILGDGKQVRSYIYIDDAVETTLLAWRKAADAYAAYNVAAEDWITVDKVADQVIEAMGLLYVPHVDSI